MVYLTQNQVNSIPKTKSYFIWISFGK